MRRRLPRALAAWAVLLLWSQFAAAASSAAAAAGGGRGGERRAQSAGGVSVYGPAGNVEAGSIASAPDVWVNQGASGTIVVANTDAVLTLPVSITFMGLPMGYTLPTSLRDSVIGFIRELMERNLDSSFTLLDVTYPGILPIGALYGGQAGGSNNGGVASWNNYNVQNGWNNWNANSNGGGGGVANGWQSQNGGAAGWQNQNGQTNWNNQNGPTNGSGAGIDWASNGVSPGGSSYGTTTVAGSGWYNNGRLALPLVVTIRSPGHLAASAMNYVIQSIQNNVQVLIEYARPMDEVAFASLTLTIGTYDLDYIVDSTDEPTRRPTNAPTRPALLPSPAEPTGRPSPQPTKDPTPLPSPGPTRDPTPLPSPAPSRNPTPLPTQRPTPPPLDPEATEVAKTVPMQFNIDDIVPGYVPSPEDQEAILEIIKSVILENLDPRLELEDVAYTSQNATTSQLPQRTRRLQRQQKYVAQNSLYLPLGITVEGRPNDIDIAYPDIINIADEHTQEILDRLKEYSIDTFGLSEVSSEASDAPDISSQTIITTHPLQFYFNGVKRGYVLSKEDRESFVAYVDEVVREKVNAMPGRELIKVKYWSRYELDAQIRDVDEKRTPSVPVRITVRGPMDENMEDVEAYLMNIVEDEDVKRDLEAHLKSLDPVAFSDVSISYEANDLPPITVPTYITDHPVQLIIKNVEAGFVFTPEIRSSITAYLKGLVADNLGSVDDSLQLVDLVYAGKLESDAQTGTTLSVPLKVTVRGPSEASDKTSEYVKEIIMEFELDMQDFLYSVDDAFKNSLISFGVYDFATLIAPSIGTEETTHSVKLFFVNAPDEFRITAEELESIIQLVQELYEDHLHDSFRFVTVTGSISDSKSISLTITVRGPADMSDTAIYFVMEVLEDHKQDLIMMLKSHDWIRFKNTLLEFEAFDPRSVESIHPVLITLIDVPAGYRLAQRDRVSILRYLSGLLGDHIDEPLELVEVTYADGWNDRSFLPLLIRVKGPADVSDFALSYVVEVLEDHKLHILAYLQTLDWDAFRDATFTISTYDPLKAIVSVVETEHLVQLILKNIPAEYRITASDRASILLLVKKLLVSYLASHELVSVEYLLSYRDRRLVTPDSNHARRLDPLHTVSLPLRINVRGPSGDADFSLAYVMDVLLGHKPDVLLMLKSLDWDGFKYAGVEFSTYTANIVTQEVVMEVSAHPVQLTLESVPDGHRLTSIELASILRFVTEVIQKHLDSRFELVKVEYLTDDNGPSGVTIEPIDSISIEWGHNSSDAMEPSSPGGNQPTGTTIEPVDVAGSDDEGSGAEETSGKQSAGGDSAAGTDEVGDSDSNNSDGFMDPSTDAPTQSTQPPVPSPTTAEPTKSPPALLPPVPTPTTAAPIKSPPPTPPPVPVPAPTTPAPTEKPTSRPTHNLRPVKPCKGYNHAKENDCGRRRLDKVTLPLLVTVRNSVELSDHALSYVMDTLQDENSVRDFLRLMQSLHWDSVHQYPSTYHVPQHHYEEHTPTVITIPVDVEETSHLVELFFENVSAGYRFSLGNRASTVRFIKEQLEENIAEPFHLVRVAIVDLDRRLSVASSLNQGMRRLNTLSLPLEISVNGPTAESDFALSYVMDVMHKKGKEQATFLKTLDPDAFRDVEVSAESYEDISSMKKAHEKADAEEEETPSLTTDGYSESSVPGASDPASSATGLSEEPEMNEDHESSEPGINKDPESSGTITNPDSSEPGTDETDENKVPGKTETVHPVQVIASNVHPGYLLSVGKSASLLIFIEELLTSSLSNVFDSVQVESGQRRRILRDAPLSIPLDITVVAPGDMSNVERAYSIIERLLDHTREIETYLKSLDTAGFSKSAVTFVSVELQEEEAILQSETMVNDADDKGDTTLLSMWWLWIIVAGVLLLLCCLCACCICLLCFKRRRNRKREEIGKAEFQPDTEHTEEHTGHSQVSYPQQNPVTMRPYLQNQVQELYDSQHHPSNGSASYYSYNSYEGDERSRASSYMPNSYALSVISEGDERSRTTGYASQSYTSYNTERSGSSSSWGTATASITTHHLSHQQIEPIGGAGFQRELMPIEASPDEQSREESIIFVAEEGSVFSVQSSRSTRSARSTKSIRSAMSMLSARSKGRIDPSDEASRGSAVSRRSTSIAEGEPLRLCAYPTTYASQFQEQPSQYADSANVFEEESWGGESYPDSYTTEPPTQETHEFMVNRRGFSSWHDSASPKEESIV